MVGICNAATWRAVRHTSSCAVWLDAGPSLRTVIVGDRRKESRALNRTPLRLAMRLLVVDDDMELCSMLRDYLQESGFSVDFEADGARGVSRTQSEFYNLVIQIGRASCRARVA